MYQCHVSTIRETSRLNSFHLPYAHFHCFWVSLTEIEPLLVLEVGHIALACCVQEV